MNDFDLSVFPQMNRTQLPDVEAGLFHPTHQLGRRYAIRLGEPNNRSKSRTLQASFKCTQDCSVYAEFDKNVHLRKPRRFPNFAQHISEGSFRA
jgi:hypothetical protein